MAQALPAHMAVAARLDACVIGPVEHAEAVFQQGVERQPRRVGPAAGQAEVDLLRGHLSLDASGVVVAQVQADGGVAPREVGRRRRDQLGNGRWRGRHAHAAAFQRAVAHHILDHAVEIGQQAHHARQEILAGRAQQDLAAGAREQLGAQRGLQLPHQRGDRGLRLEQAARRMRETAFLGHGHEGGQVLERDVLGQAIHCKLR
ncbi:Uncharacterised protein [Bordetella pertussis]|nr:Uncharacterised protein [Bordetella pertussis]CFN82237.1 Uncharacterised protein [Bordetella pertussis]CFO01960.1 Uncharacterised protein [Bordetella pertussis]CFO06737.1 Uncharacterised protein [Bordetella pertussis]CFO31415.1 Uncharacterised protein [Bordetella pertussis]